MQYLKPINIIGSSLRLAYTIFKPLKIKRKNGLFDKNHGLLFSGKMSKKDVDFARYLIHKGKRNYNICEFFGISRPSYTHICSRVSFDKHISPFEKLINGCHPVIDESLIKKYEMENEILIGYYNSYCWRK